MNTVLAVDVTLMRIKIVQTPKIAMLDGVDLQRFQHGHTYDVGPQLGALLLAEGWAEPLDDDTEPFLIPFSDCDPFLTRTLTRTGPPNLQRETYPPYVDELALAADKKRRKRKRSTDT